MRDTAQVLVLISRAGVDVNSNAGEMAWESFSGDADAVRKGGYLIEFCWVLCLVSSSSELTPISYK